MAYTLQPLLQHQAAFVKQVGGTLQLPACLSEHCLSTTDEALLVSFLLFSLSCALEACACRQT
eukprot:6210513-Pleurochrysis_carterae.AAC.1